MATATKARSTKGKTSKKAAAETKAPARKKKKEALKDLSVTYDQFKEFEGNKDRKFVNAIAGEILNWYNKK